MRLARLKHIDPDTLMTKFIRGTPPDETSVFVCDNVSEFNSAQTTAYFVKKETREDGYKYKVTLDSRRMTVSVKLVKQE